MSRIKKRRKYEEPVNTQAWLLTYSDMVTLILSFFILLYSMSTINVEEFKLIISSFQNALGILKGGETIILEEDLISSGTEGPFAGIESPEDIEFYNIYSEMQELINSEGIEGKIEVNQEERGLVIRLLEGAFFDSGRAVLKEEAVELLDEVAFILKGVDKQIRIEGHTDNVPINTERFPSNWELSAARSVTVLKYLLVEHGFSPYQLAAVGYGEYRPVVPNTTLENKALNRRVDIVVLRTEATKGEAK